MRQFITLGVVVALAALVFNARVVAAEDDCADPTYAVERVPYVGIVCFWEG